MEKVKFDFPIIDFKAQIHPDGDVYVLVENKYHYLGKLGESDFGTVPDKYYEKIKELLKDRKNAKPTSKTL